MFTVTLSYHVPLSPCWHLVMVQNTVGETAGALEQSKAVAPNGASNQLFVTTTHSQEKRKKMTVSFKDIFIKW